MKNESTEVKNASGGSGEAANSTRASESKRPGASKRARKKPTKRAKAKPRGRRARSLSAAADESKTPVTEKPVPLEPREKTSQYMITVDNASGLATKIEKLDPKTGKKKELSQSEYLQLVTPNLNPQVSNFESLGAPTSGNADATEAYYRGVADYLSALGLS